jgi:cell wall-associated NlpC family hydrolase
MFATGIMSAALFLSIPSATAKADSFISAEQGIAGISAVLENTTNEQLAAAYNSCIDSDVKKESPYANLGVSKANDYVNIRKEPSTDSEVVGVLNRGCAADILEKLDGDWVKIKSGNVEGYIASLFLAIGDQAEAMVDEYAMKYATVVNTSTLRVRGEKNTDSQTITLIPEGEVYPVKKEYDDWASIILSSDDASEDDYIGYVSKDYVHISVEFKFALSMKEIMEQQKREEESKRAEAERKAELAAEQSSSHSSSSSSSGGSSSGSSGSSSSSHSDNNSSGSSSGSSGSGSASGEKVVNYALKFVGNRYVYGGTSLTNGTDCSGFVQSVYGDFGISLPRTSREQAQSAGEKVDEGNLQPGDLLFYTNSSGTVSHVAMYIGGGQIVHAANTRQGIITSHYRYRDIYCTRRIVH